MATTRTSIKFQERVSDPWLGQQSGRARAPPHSIGHKQHWPSPHLQLAVGLAAVVDETGDVALEAGVNYFIGAQGHHVPSDGEVVSESSSTKDGGGGRAACCKD